jgi:hypothetical protein
MPCDIHIREQTQLPWTNLSTDIVPSRGLARIHFESSPLSPQVDFVAAILSHDLANSFPCFARRHLDGVDDEQTFGFPLAQLDRSPETRCPRCVGDGASDADCLSLF